jgi:hypothetical protein
MSHRHFIRVINNEGDRLLLLIQVNVSRCRKVDALQRPNTCPHTHTHTHTHVHIHLSSTRLNKPARADPDAAGSSLP